MESRVCAAEGCGRVVEGRRRQAAFCSRACAQRERKRRARAREREAARAAETGAALVVELRGWVKRAAALEAGAVRLEDVAALAEAVRLDVLGRVLERWRRASRMERDQAEAERELRRAEAQRGLEADADAQR